MAEEPRTAPPAAEDLTYAQTLEGDDVPEASLDRPRPTPRSGGVAARPSPPTATPKPTASPPPTTRPAPPRATPPPTTAPAPVPRAAGLGAPGTFSIQVGAFKDKASAESVQTRLKAKGFAAFVVAPKAAGGLYNVRVGSYGDRAEAERVQTLLRDEEKFQSFIVKQ